MLVAGSANGMETIFSFRLGPRTPQAGLTVGANGFFGTTVGGGIYGYGTVFELAPNGTFSNLYSLDYSNGVSPQASLALGEDGNLYGVSYQGGKYGLGTVFVLANGILTNLISFNGTNPAYMGANPLGGLIYTNKYWYGTTSAGGPNASGKITGFGTVYRLSPKGDFTTLVKFNYNNGASPEGPLLYGSDGNFYGTTFGGGYLGNGTVFKMTRTGRLTTLHVFNFDDGAGPASGLVQDSSGVLYGTTSGGGSSAGDGAIFSITTNGDFRSLGFFDGINGSNPQSSLLPVGGNLYGSTYAGGANGMGTMFKVTTDGVLTSLASFDYANGANPQGALMAYTNDVIYGVAANGGQYGSGAVFRLSQNGDLAAFAAFNPGGGFPSTGLTSAYGNLYGALLYGGSGGTAMAFGMSLGGALNMLVSLNTGGEAAAYGPLVLSTVISTNTSLTTNTVITTSSTVGSTSSAVTNTTNTVVSFTLNPTGSTNATDMTFSESTNTVVTTNTAISVSTDSTTNASPTATALTVTTTSNVTITVTSSATVSLDTNIIAITTNITANALDSSNIQTVTNVTTSLASVTPTTTVTTNSIAIMTATAVTFDVPAFYGTTYNGGSANLGTIFSVATNGLVSNLVSFATSDGAHPEGGLTLGSDGNLYGSTTQGGPSGAGVVFKIAPEGGSLDTLTPFVDYVSGEGVFPEGELAQASNGDFYGVTYEGGSSGLGAVFKVTTNGNLTTLFSFAGTNGSYPQTGLVFGADRNLYGTTSAGGAQGYGVVFQMTSNGVMTDFASFSQDLGEDPQGPLLQGSGNWFCGTAQTGGSNGFGTVFCYSPGATNSLTTIAAFDGTNNGAYPLPGLARDAVGNLYGAAMQGGTNGAGTIFRLPAPKLNYAAAGGQLVLSWPVGAVVTNLQLSASLRGPWRSVFASGVVGRFYQWATNNVGGTTFYRLARTYN